MVSSISHFGTGSLWDAGKRNGKSGKARQAAGSVIKEQFATAVRNTNLQDLASRFHSTHMDQKEYDDFLDALVGLGITSRYSPDPEAMNCREGDMLAYVKYQSQIIYEPPTESSERSKSLYRKIAAIMEQMERNR